MPDVPATDVTSLLLALGSGDGAALDRLIPLVYSELRLIARGHMQRERTPQTLESAALVNEAYLRLVDLRRIQWRDRSHFMAISARLMRRILVEHARGRGAAKRGGGAVRVSIGEADQAIPGSNVDMAELDDALCALAELDERRAQVVELRYFGGLTVPEAAEALHVSEETVLRDWKLARAWLFRYLRGGMHVS